MKPLTFILLLAAAVPVQSNQFAHFSGTVNSNWQNAHKQELVLADNFPTKLQTILPANLLQPASQQGRITSSPVCSAVWSKEGTICNPQAVLSFAISRNEITINPNLVQQQLAAKQTHVQPVNRKLAMARAVIKSPSFSTGTIAAPVNAKATANFNPGMLLLEEQTVKPLIEFDKARFTNQMNECWRYLSHARNVSMCYACSQQNSKYFEKGKAIIKQTDCNNMLSKCLPFFNTIADYLKNAHTTLSKLQIKSIAAPVAPVRPRRILTTLRFTTSMLPKSTKTLTLADQGTIAKVDSWAKSWTQEQLTILNNLYSAMTKANLVHLLDQHTKSSVGIARQNAANRLCLKLFVLYKDPIFGLVEQLFHTESGRKLFMGLDMSAGSNGNDSGADRDPFEGDVAILSDGPGGSWLQTADSQAVPVGHGTKEAMNMTMAFP